MYEVPNDILLIMMRAMWYAEIEGSMDYRDFAPYIAWVKTLSEEQQKFIIDNSGVYFEDLINKNDEDY